MNYDEDNEGTMQPASSHQQQTKPHAIENDDPQQRQHEDSGRRNSRTSSGAGGVIAIGLPSNATTSPRLSNKIAVGLPATDDKATTELISKLVATDLAKQDHKEKVIATGADAVVKQRPPPAHRQSISTTADDELAAAKRHERERGPSVASAVVKARSPPARKTSRNNDNNVVTTVHQERGNSVNSTAVARSSNIAPPNDGSSHSRSSQVDLSSQHSRSSRSGLDSSSTHSYEKKPAASDAAMSEAKRREREQGPLMATARAPLHRNALHPIKSTTGAEEKSGQSGFDGSMAAHSKEDRKTEAKGSELNYASSHSRDGTTPSTHDFMMESTGCHPPCRDRLTRHIS